MNPSPLPLQPEVVEQFRLAMTRVDGDDWDAFTRRVDAARKLAVRAFLEKDRAAWETVQVITRRLQKNSNLRPTEMGDVAVLDTIYRIEESTIPKLDLPRGLTPREFAQKLEKDLGGFGGANHEGFRNRLKGMSREDWVWAGYQIVPQAFDFCRMIAISSIPLPHELARFMWYNLFDEGGRGDLDRMHHTMLGKFLTAAGVKWRDEEEVHNWAAPDVIGLMNTQKRLLWHQEPAYSLGSMFFYEKLVPEEMELMMNRLLALGFTEDDLAWFPEHLVIDVQHAEDWLGVVEAYVSDYESQQMVYQAAIERARWANKELDEWVVSCRTWQETGVPPHLPFRELRAATGL